MLTPNSICLRTVLLQSMERPGLDMSHTLYPCNFSSTGPVSLPRVFDNSSTVPVHILLTSTGTESLLTGRWLFLALEGSRRGR